MKRLLLLPMMFALWACVGFGTSGVPDASSPFEGFNPPAASASAGVVSVPLDPTSHKLGASYPAIPIPAAQAEGDLLAFHTGAWNGLAPGTTGFVLTSTGTSSLPSWQAAGAGASVTGTGLWHSTSGTLDGAAFIGTAGQIPITNAGATNTPWVSLSGDCTLAASGAITCAKLNGTSFPAGGSLTTGNGPYVSGASAVTYQALNLAGGTGWVTGVLPTANQAVQTMGGDVNGNTGAATVIGIRGVSVPSVPGSGTTVLTDTAGALSWAATTSSPPFDITVTTAGGTSTAHMPVGKVWLVLVNIATSFSAGATAAVGYSGSTSAVTSGIDLTQPAGLYVFEVATSWPAPAAVLVTLSGAPSVGSAEILVFGGAVQT